MKRKARASRLLIWRISVPFLNRILTFYPFRTLVEWILLSALCGIGGLISPAIWVGLLVVVVAINIDHCPIVRAVFSVVFALVLLVALELASFFVILFFRAGPIYTLWLVAGTAVVTLIVGRFKLMTLRTLDGLLIGFLLTLSLGCAWTLRSPGKTEFDQLSVWNFVMDSRSFPKLKASPRFMETDPEEETLFISYRIYPFQGDSDTRCRYPLIVVDLASHATKPVYLDCGEVIGLAYDPWDDVCLAQVVFNKDKNKGSPPILFWVDRHGNVKKQVALTGADPRQYRAVIVPSRDNILIQYGCDSLYRYNRTSGTASPLPNRMSSGLFISDGVVAGDRILFASGGGVIMYLFSPAVISYRLTDFTQIASLNKHLLGGAYVLAHDPVAREIYVNSQWSGHFTVADDQSLQVRRTFNVGGVIRTLALNPYQGLGYAADVLSGDLIEFSMDSGHVIRKIPGASGTRCLLTTKNGNLFAGTRCGVVLMDINRLSDKTPTSHTKGGN